MYAFLAYFVTNYTTIPHRIPPCGGDRPLMPKSIQATLLPLLPSAPPHFPRVSLVSALTNTPSPKFADVIHERMAVQCRPSTSSYAMTKYLNTPLRLTKSRLVLLKIPQFLQICNLLTQALLFVCGLCDKCHI